MKTSIVTSEPLSADFSKLVCYLFYMTNYLRYLSLTVGPSSSKLYKRIEAWALIKHVPVYFVIKSVPDGGSKIISITLSRP